MNNIQKRFLMFLIGCIGARSLIVLIAKNISLNKLPILGYISLIPATGFAYIYLTKSRKQGAEVFGGKIWWDYMRPIHSFFHFAFAYYAINKNKNSWKLLAADVVIGLLAFLNYHYQNKNFSKLF